MTDTTQLNGGRHAAERDEAYERVAQAGLVEISDMLELATQRITESLERSQEARQEVREGLESVDPTTAPTWGERIHRTLILMSGVSVIFIAGFISAAAVYR